MRFRRLIVVAVMGVFVFLSHDSARVSTVKSKANVAKDRETPVVSRDMDFTPKPLQVQRTSAFTETVHAVSVVSSIPKVIKPVAVQPVTLAATVFGPRITVSGLRSLSTMAGAIWSG